MAPPSLCYATVHKVRRLGRVARVVIRLVFGTAAQLHDDRPRRTLDGCRSGVLKDEAGGCDWAEQVRKTVATRNDF